ncbi:hypothetical protein B9Z19DRAFT_1118946 [Tuber borchii]|uniref:Uncharacterized protein n=1 Tax=Tuber borchii TaxID=42251 RepID=A0A2T7A779_TUBBO|nr:hypothetical protein B9Z19DRAFT_1118946 [Tuber borchii]
MSQQSQTTDATEIDLQPNSWDLPGDLPSQSMESLGTGYLQPISELSDGDSASALSSALSGMLTPTLEALSNMESMTNPDPAESLLYERKKKIRKSWVYWTQNGYGAP